MRLFDEGSSHKRTAKLFPKLKLEIELKLGVLLLAGQLVNVPPNAFSPAAAISSHIVPDVTPSPSLRYVNIP